MENHYGHMEPFPGADPGSVSLPRTRAHWRERRGAGARSRTVPCAVRRRSRTMHTGEAGEPGLEPGLFWARTRRVARLHHSPLASRTPTPEGIACARWDSNPQHTAF